jgi:hypothetical protein
MQVPQIRLESTYAQIGIRTNHAHLAIEQPKADLTIEQPKANMSIQTNQSKLTIDQSKAREQMDLKSIFKRQDEASQLGYNGVLEGIARRAAEGEQLMKIENGGNAIASIAKQKSNPKPKELGKNWAPMIGNVNIEYTPSKVEIIIEPKKPIIHVQPNKPIFTYSPGKVEYMMEQYPSLKIDFVNKP